MQTFLDPTHLNINKIKPELPGITSLSLLSVLTRVLACTFICWSDMLQEGHGGCNLHTLAEIPSMSAFSIDQKEV